MGVVAASSRADWEREVSRGLMGMAIPDAGSDFTGTIDYTEAGERCVVSLADASPCVVARTPAMAAKSADDTILFAVLLEGDSILDHGEVATSVGAGAGTLITAESAHTQRFLNHHRGVALHVGLDRLGLSAHQARSLSLEPVSVDVASFAVLHQFLRGYADAWHLVSDEVRRRYAHTACDLLSVVLWDLASASPAPVDPGRTFLRARDVILDHLDDPGLDVAYIARELRLSPRSIHAAFAAVGASPAGFVRNRRLERASLLLSRSSMSVGEVSSAVGFADVTTFTRSFKRAHGVSPGQWRHGLRGDTVVA